MVEILSTVGAILGSLGALIAGYGTYQLRKVEEGKVETERFEAVYGTMGSHMGTLSNENNDLRVRVTQQDARINELETQFRKCQEDKFDMAIELKKLREELTGEGHP